MWWEVLITVGPFFKLHWLECCITSGVYYKFEGSSTVTIAPKKKNRVSQIFNATNFWIWVMKRATVVLICVVHKY